MKDFLFQEVSTDRGLAIVFGVAFLFQSVIAYQALSLLADLGLL